MTLPRRFGSVVEDVAQVGVAGAADDLRADHPVAAVFLRGDAAVFQGFREAGPAGAGVVFVLRVVEGRVADDAMVGPLFFVVEPFPSAGRLRGGFLGDLVGEWVESLAQGLGVGGVLRGFLGGHGGGEAVGGCEVCCRGAGGPGSLAAKER